MMMRPKRPKQLSMAANWPGEMFVRMGDVLATPGSTPGCYRVGVSVSHLDFIVVPLSMFLKFC